ncbi:hypothetical protein NYF95_002391 [Salmonella enterica]|nr:hypothetical protein [Salmonella enterica]
MNDWRTKPRIGRSKIKEHAEEIKTLISEGKTNRQIYTYLLSSKDFLISESQFNRYMKKMFKDDMELYKYPLLHSAVNDVKTINNSNSFSSSFYEWNNIGVKNQKLIEDLEKSGYTPDIIRGWGLSESQIRQRLIVQNQKQKGK